MSSEIPPICILPQSSARSTRTPNERRASPGTRKRCVGLYSSINLRCRQPSEIVLSLDVPRRLRYGTGISAVRRSARALLRIISEANSMPVVRKPILSIALRENPLIPQWASEKLVPESLLSTQVRTGTPIWR